MVELRVKVREADFKQDRDALRLIRNSVFVEEQSVPLALEYDERDPLCRHVLACIDGQPVGTGRLDVKNSGKIGRVAVLAPYRGQGVGEQLMQALHQIAARDGLPQLRLNAQVSALAFYQRLGYQPYGERFVEAGIDHQAMLLELVDD